jgi:hypothetical protein
MSAVEEVLAQVLGAAIPIASSWIRSRLEAGDDPAKVAADLEALFQIADRTIDAAEDAKFGPR